MLFSLFFSIIFVIILLKSAVCLAAIYVGHDSSGNLQYSDVPGNPSAKPLNLPSAPTVSEPASPAPDLPVIAPLPSKPAGSYKTFQIISPADQASIQNQVTIPVQIALQPPLIAGDMIQLLLDGKPAGNPSASTTISLENVLRGTHQLTAIILDKNQITRQESNTITIFVHKSPLTSPARAQPVTQNVINVTVLPAEAG